MFKSIFRRKPKQVINNYTCWYKMIEIFLIINTYIKNRDNRFDELKVGINTNKTPLNNNKFLEQLLKRLLLNNDHIIFKKLQEYNHCNNLPFFELIIIDLLKANGISVIDLFCLDGNNYYPNLHKYYTYDNNLNFNNNKHLLNNSFYKSYLNDIYDINDKRLDILIVSHWIYNQQLTTYFNNFKSELLKKYKKNILISKNNIGFNFKDFNITLNEKQINYNLIACILRNNNNDRQQKNILGIIYNSKQFIIDDTKDDIFVEFNWILDNQFNNETYIIIDANRNKYNYNFATGDKLFIYNIDKCTNLDVIPQFLDTCWFNAILMASLYSQGSRNILLKKIKDNNWGNEDSFQKVLKSILIQSHNPDKTKIQKLYKKIKPENILLKMISKYDKYLKKELKKKLKKISNLGWLFDYIVKYLKYIGMKCLDIYYYKDVFFGNFYNYTKIIFDDDYLSYIKNNNFKSEKNNEELIELLKDEGPDYLILFHSSLYENVDIFYEYWYEYSSENTDSSNFNIDKYIKDNEQDYINYKDIIHFNGNKYKLDSCLLANYNKNDKEGHAIIGLTCNNKRYVYNGWNQNKKAAISPCSLMPYDWNLNKQEGFCLNPKDCKLDSENKDKLCYSFNKGDRILIYTKIIEENNEIINFNELSKTNSLSHMSSIVKDVYNLKNYTKEQIINYLVKNHKYKEDDLKDETLSNLKKLLKTELKEHYNVKNISSSPKGVEISLNPINIQIEQQ